MKLHCIEHSALENPGQIAVWAEAKKHSLTVSKAHAGEPFPQLESFEALVLLGGTFRVDQEKEFPWLAEEKAFLKTVIAKEKKIVGIAQGAELLAEALGAKITRAKFKEVGWFTLELTPQAQKHKVFKGLPSPFLAFEWHGDTFELPPGAQAVVQGALTANQGFLVEKKYLGLQFHPEITFETIAAWLKARPEITAEALKEPYIQRPYQMLASPERFTATQTWLDTVLTRFF